MDVSPPWYTPTSETCLGETLRCGGGDQACHRQAEHDGYVAVSLYTFCRREDVRTVPRPAGAALLVGFLVLVSIALWRVRRARSR